MSRSIFETKLKYEYNGYPSIVAALTDEWLRVTTDGDPVPFWPLNDRVQVDLDVEIDTSKWETIKDIVFRHFDGNRETPLFPIADIEMKYHVGRTRIIMIGDRQRAGEMQSVRSLF